MISSLPTLKLSRHGLSESYLSKFFQPLRKSKFLAVLLSTLAIVNTGYSQVNGYSFSTSTGNALETGSFTNLLGINLDDDVSAVNNIGFTFNYGGIDYTDFSATSNGLLAFGTSATTDYNNYTTSLTGPYLMAYWDDNYTDNNGNVQYLLLGAPGSRKLVVDYNLSFLGNPGTADKHFQIWLFETTNNVVFVYGNGNDLNNEFSIGILTDGSSDFISVDAGTHASGTVTQIDNNTTWPGAGRAYSFSSTGGTLPVTFLNFSGSNDGSSNLLRWSTANENNNRGFEVQRSQDGISYSVLDFVNSKALNGNSTSLLNYTFTDHHPAGTRQYYRLRQVDIDQRSELSNIISIEGEKPLRLTIDRLFPNPARNFVTIQVSAPYKEKITIVLADMSGKILRQKVINAEAGVNTLTVDISQTIKANCLLKVIDANGHSTTYQVVVSK